MNRNKPSIRWRLLGAVSVIATAAAGSASAQSSVADQISRLQAQIEGQQRQIEAQQRELQNLKAKVSNKPPEKGPEQAYATAPPQAKAPPSPPSAVAKMSASNRPSICTVDGLNCIALTSRLQLDVGGYWYSPNTAATSPQQLDNGVNARRSRIGVLGTFMGDWNYALVYDFGGSSDGFGGTASGSLPGGGTSGIENAYLSYTGIKPFGGNVALEAGYMDVLYTLGESMSSNDILFMERASSNVIATNIAAGDFRSAAGGRWYNDWFWIGAYATGPSSGAIHSGSSTSPAATTEQLGGVARAVLQYTAAKDVTFHLGGDAEFLFNPPHNIIANTYTLTLSDRPELRIDPTSILSTGSMTNVKNAAVYSVEAATSYGPFFAQGEYFWYNVNRQSFTGLPNLNFNGGYVEASFVLTGETHTYNAGNAAYNGIIPANPFGWSSAGPGVMPVKAMPASWGWGAWEIAGRYSVINLNDRLGFASPDGVAGGRQTIYTAGLNWYVNRSIRFMFNYLHGTIDKQASPTDTADVGARFDAVATRMQVAF
jgi:phosphate-selective porin OprO/OprP